MNLLRKLAEKARLIEMAKNMRKKGHSARNGNAPSPYQKYNKTPYRYSSAYYDWHRARKANKPTVEREKRVDKPRDYSIAAE